MDEPEASEEYRDVRRVEGDPLGELDEMSEGNDGDWPYDADVATVSRSKQVSHSFFHR